MLHHCGKACVCHDSSSLPLSRAVIDEPKLCTQGLGGWDMRLDEPKPCTQGLGGWDMRLDEPNPCTQGLSGWNMRLDEPNPGPSVGGVQP